MNIETILKLLPYNILPFIDKNKIFQYSCKNGCLKMVQQLWLDPDIRENAAANENYALRHASKHGHTNIVMILWQSPDVRANAHVDENHALRCACKNGHFHIVQLLLQSPEVRTTEHYDDKTALLNSIEGGNFKVVELLLRLPHVRTYPNFYDDTESVLNGNEMLNCACRKGNQEVFELIWQEPQIRFETNNYGRAILWVTISRNLNIVKILCQEPLILNKLDNYAVNHLFLKLSTRKKDFEFVQLLLSLENINFVYHVFFEIINENHAYYSYSTQWNIFWGTDPTLANFHTCLAVSMIESPMICNNLQSTLNKSQWQSMLLDLIKNYNNLNIVLAKTTFINLPSEILNIIHLYCYNQNSILNFLARRLTRFEFRKVINIIEHISSFKAKQVQVNKLNEINSLVQYKPFFDAIYMKNLIQDIQIRHQVLELRN